MRFLLSAALLLSACSAKVVFVEDGESSSGGQGGSGAQSANGGQSSVGGTTTNGGASTNGGAPQGGGTSIATSSSAGGSFPANIVCRQDMGALTEQCSACAEQAQDCAFEGDQCFKDQDCAAYSECIQSCSSNGACCGACDAQFPGQYERLVAVYSCFICNTCPECGPVFPDMICAFD